MVNIIEARVKQKKDTLANWEANDLVLLDGEQAFVVNGDGQPVNFKIGDGTKRFSDLPYWIDYAGGQYISIDGNALPTPAVDVGYTFVGPGTYTFAGQADIVAPDGRFSQLVWDGTSWGLKDMGELPTSPKTDSVEEGNHDPVESDAVAREAMLNRKFVNVSLSPTGKNLFNKDAVTYGKWINTSTGIIEDVGENFSISEPIPVRKGEYFTASGNFSSISNNRWAFITNPTDVNPHTYINSVNTVETPVNGFMVVMTSNFNTSIVDTLQIERGLVATSYEPFDGIPQEKIHEVYLPDRILDVELNGKVEEGNNALIDGDTAFKAINPVNDTLQSLLTRRNFFDKTNIITGQLLSSNAELPTGTIVISSSAAWARTYPIRLDPGDYKILGITINQNSMFAGLFDTPVTEASGSVLGQRITTNTFSVPPGEAKYLTFSVKSGTFEADLDVIQVKPLSATDDYESYDTLSIRADKLPTTEELGGNGNLEVMINPTNVRVRSYYDEDFDIVQEYQYQNIPSNNGVFSGARVYKISKGMSISEVNMSYSVHSIGDSISPMGTVPYWFIAGQHGYYIAKATAAGNTFSVNQEVKDNLDREFTVIHKVGADLYLAPKITRVGDIITRSWTQGSSTFTSLSTLDDVTTFSVSAVTNHQVKPMADISKQKILIDGKEVSETGIYKGVGSVELVDVANFVNPIGAVFNGISGMTGDTLMTISQSYYFKEGSVYLTHNLDMGDSLQIIKYHGIQPLGLVGSNGYVPYVMFPKVKPQPIISDRPAVDWNSPTDASSTSVYYSKYLFQANSTDIEDVNDIPDRTVQFLRNSSGEFRLGFAAGFDLESGFASKQSRPLYTSQAFEMIPSLNNKTYFRVLTDTKFSDGVLPSSFLGQFNAYFTYYKPKEDVQSYIVHTKDTSYIYIHIQDVFDKVSVDARGLEGAKLEIVENKGVTLLTDRIVNEKVFVKTSDANANYLVLKTV